MSSEIRANIRVYLYYCVTISVEKFIDSAIIAQIRDWGSLDNQLGQAQTGCRAIDDDVLRIYLESPFFSNDVTTK